MTYGLKEEAHDSLQTPENWFANPANAAWLLVLRMYEFVLAPSQIITRPPPGLKAVFFRCAAIQPRQTWLSGSTVLSDIEFRKTLFPPNPGFFFRCAALDPIKPGIKGQFLHPSRPHQT